MHVASGALPYVTLVAFALGGCVRSPETAVEADWNATMARYNMIGLYPITEDLQPGDVLLHLPSEVGPQPTLRRIGSLKFSSLRAAMEEQEERRLRVQVGSPSAPRQSPPVDSPPSAAPASASVTTTANAPSGATIMTNTTVRPTPVPRAATGERSAPKAAATVAEARKPKPLLHHVIAADSGFGDEPALPRMRRLAMPAIAAARITEASLGGGGPLGTGAIGGALGFGSKVAVWVRLKDAEMLGIDEGLAYKYLDKERVQWIRENLPPRFLLEVLSSNAPSVVRRLCTGAAPPRDRALLRVVNRVLYAHSIEYEYAGGSAYAGRLAADLARVVATSGQISVPGAAASAPASAGAAPAAGTSAGAATAVSTAVANLSALQQGITAALPSRPGVMATVGIGTFGNVAVTETSKQPLAVAYVPLVSYSIRGSLLLTAQDEPGAEQQMSELRAVCEAELDEHAGRPYAEARVAEEKAPGAIRRRTSIEELVCNNTGGLIVNGRSQGLYLPYPALCRATGENVSAGGYTRGESLRRFSGRPGET